MKSLFVVPVYPPHFHFAYNLIESFQKYDLNADLMFVFTNQVECDSFGTTKYTNVVIPKEYSNLNVQSGIISLKKFYGLSQAFDYDYAATIDSECVFVKSINTYECMKRFCEEKTVYATPVNESFTKTVIMSPFKFFNENDKKQLNQLINGGLNFFWFNNLPIYDMKIVKAFLQFINLTEKFSTFTFFDFDYIIYMYYALLYNNYKLKVLPQELCVCGDSGPSLMEFLGYNRNNIDIKKQQEIIDYIRPYWVFGDSRTKHDNIFLNFHLDRVR